VSLEEFCKEEPMSLLSFEVSSISFYISTLFYLLACILTEFSKVFTKHSLKVLMFSKDP
jgi:hypothetical protein